MPRKDTVTQAVILAAGLGTRVLPLTKSIPKALLPLGAKPAIHWLVEECLASGIKDLVIVNAPHSPVVGYFQRDQWLYDHLRAKGNRAELRVLQALDRLRLKFVVQDPLLGEVHALTKALPYLRRNAPFGVLFSDNLFTGRKPALREAIDLFRKHGMQVKGNGRYIFDASSVPLIRSFDFADHYRKDQRGVTLGQVFDSLAEGKDFMEQFASACRHNTGDLASYFRAFNVFASLSRPKRGN